MNPRVDTEGDGELRAKVARVLYEAPVPFVHQFSPPPWELIPDSEYTREVWLGLADVVLGVFGDVERELAQLREAAEDALGAWDNTTDDYWALGPFMDALRAVLASAVQSEDPKQ